MSINEPIFLLFGTGWGLTYNTLQLGDFILKPIEGISDYNHLSVRAASAIILYLLSESRKNFLRLLE
jgi:tRNA (guanine37-N1)-methyltransferase